MPGIIHIFNPDHNNFVGQQLLSYDDRQTITGEKYLKLIVSMVRELGKLNDVKIPKRIRYGGDHSGWTYVSYTSNKMRDLVVQAIKHYDRLYVLDKDYDFKEFQAKLKRLGG